MKCLPRAAGVIRDGLKKNLVDIKTNRYYDASRASEVTYRRLFTVSRAT